MPSVPTQVPLMVLPFPDRDGLSRVPCLPSLPHPLGSFEKGGKSITHKYAAQIQSI